MMFRFIRKAVSTLTWPVRTAATYLLQNAVKKDLSWAIKPLIWLGADCNATFNTVYNQETRQYRTETILSYAILNNKSLATWLLSLPAIKQQVKNDTTYKALITVTSCIVKEGDDATYKNLNIEQKLLELKHINASAAVSALEQHEIYGIDTAKEIILMVREEKLLHESNNIILNTAIKFALYTGTEDFKHIANKLLIDNDVKAELKNNLAPKNQDITRQAVIKYFNDAGFLFEILDISWVIAMFRQNIGLVHITTPPPESKEEKIARNHNNSIAREARDLEEYKRQHEKSKNPGNTETNSSSATVGGSPMLTQHQEFMKNQRSHRKSETNEYDGYRSESPDSSGSQSPKYGAVHL